MIFGALGKCSMCGGELEYYGGRYRCRGYLSAWSKCSFSTTDPECLKGKWKIHEEMDNEYLRQWFKSQKGKKLGLTVAVVGNLKESHAEWKTKLEAIGGRLLRKITRDIDCVVTNESEIEKHKSEIEKVVSMKVPVLRESFLVHCLEKQRRLPMVQYKIEEASRADVIKVKVKGKSSVHEESGLQEAVHGEIDT
eukprot:Gb_16606 [translate_table: standard]